MLCFVLLFFFFFLSLSNFLMYGLDLIFIYVRPSKNYYFEVVITISDHWLSLRYSVSLAEQLLSNMALSFGENLTDIKQACVQMSSFSCVFVSRSPNRHYTHTVAANNRRYVIRQWTTKISPCPRKSQLWSDIMSEQVYVEHCCVRPK